MRAPVARRTGWRGVVWDKRAGVDRGAIAGDAVDVSAGTVAYLLTK